VFRDDAAVRYSLAVVTVIGLIATVTMLAAGLASYRRSVAYRAQWMDGISASGTR
jgi:hypothetical protein